MFAYRGTIFICFYLHGVRGCFKVIEGIAVALTNIPPSSLRSVLEHSLSYLSLPYLRWLICQPPLVTNHHDHRPLSSPLKQADAERHTHTHTAGNGLFKNVNQPI